ncbi:hypothetical protein [Pelagerythrobacter aerophilus]|uniref:Uncharacterized protein n=1 Tax=Pelagerythrobacter aerophilus TaxID=2306995 RepID=A0A418NE08_9SPHN|nr:hypothetical protein [Pelagerythrobacter aerophilus]RIV75474.1 hypothetical protein D2V04_14280 [Pelagerythrobacter aerophilus]
MSSTSSIDIDVDRRLQERHWFISRILWVIMLALVLVALLGLTGSGGALSRQHVAAGAAELDIPRVGRWSATDHLAVKVDQPAPNGLEILLPAKFAEIFAVEAVSPRPSSVTATAEGHRYTFDSSAEPGQRSIVFSIRPSRILLSSHMGRFEVNGARTADLPIAVLP